MCPESQRINLQKDALMHPTLHDRQHTSFAGSARPSNHGEYGYIEAISGSSAADRGAATAPAPHADEQSEPERHDLHRYRP
jgi:hypothetical protein